MDNELDDLTAETTFDGDIATIRIAGEIDLATRDTVTSAAHAAVAAGAARLILDLSAVTFMDSAGIADRLRIDVSDAGPGTPIVRSPSPGENSAEGCGSSPSSPMTGD